MTAVRPHIVMILDQDFPPDLRVENEARTLLDAGYDVTVLSIAPDHRPVHDSVGGVRIVRARIPAQVRNKMRGLAGMLPFLHAFVWWQVLKINRVHRISALHAHDLYVFGPALMTGRRLGVPVVGDMHENWVEAIQSYAWSTRIPGRWVARPERWQRLEDKWTRALDGLVVVIDEMADRLTARGMPPDRITVVPNTIRLEAFNAWPVDAIPELPTNGPILLYTGGMDKHRGLEDAVDAMPRILASYPDARLVLVGDGATRKALEARCRESGVGDAVVFAGWQPQPRVKSYMARASIGLIPHLKTAHTDNTIPHKLFHYMHMQLPVVASNCTPLVRILTETGAGETYTSGNPSELAARITHLLSHNADREAMGERGKSAVQSRWHWEATARGLVHMYGRLLSNL